MALSPRERQILALRRGLTYVPGLYEEAKKLGVPMARVDEIKARAEVMLMRKLAKQRDPAA